MQVRNLEPATLVSGIQLNECDFFFVLPTLINDIVIRRNATVHRYVENIFIP